MEIEKQPKDTKSIADWLPELSQLLTEDVFASTAKKKRPQATVAAPKTTTRATHTTEKFKPQTIAEMRADIEYLKSAKKSRNNTFSAMKQTWNSSVKVDKRKSQFGDAQKKYNPVRKVLDFQARPGPNYSRMTMATEVPKFHIPEARPKKALCVQKAKANIRISGVYKLPETPVETKKKIKPRQSIANKENVMSKINIPSYNKAKKTQLLSPKPRVFVPPSTNAVLDTPMSNDSWKSSCDASFLQKEKEINDCEINEAQAKKIIEQEVAASPPISTPFKEYRNVQDFFNNSSDIDNSNCDNTIMCFEKQSVCQDSTSHKQKITKADEEDTVIVTLCDLFNKATVNSNEMVKSELDILLEMKKETENNIQTQIKLLKYINRLIQKKASGSTVKALIENVNVSKILMLDNDDGDNQSIDNRVSVIKTNMSKSPLYKIPRKNPIKKTHKSMPDIPSSFSPRVGDNKALNMYMKMKAQMNFLTTPKLQKTRTIVPDTPAVTSRNLQVQLDKLFNGS